MGALYDRIRQRNPGGMPYPEAVQLFLWIYCTTDILPVELRSDALDRENLTLTFANLTREHVIVDDAAAKGALIDQLFWDRLASDLLAKSIALDPAFPSRISRYV